MARINYLQFIQMFEYYETRILFTYLIVSLVCGDEETL